MNLTAPHEPSTWLAGRIADLTSRLDQGRTRAISTGVFLLAELTERPTGRRARQRWEFSCDRCGTYVPSGRGLVMSAQEAGHHHGARLVVTFGLCRECAALEYGAETAEGVIS